VCGIAGLYLRDGACQEGVLTRMREIISHRGPDDAGNFLDGPLGFGHRRLSIIDLGTGHQPMTTADGRFTIAFNGEIYNYRELRRKLGAQGVEFRTKSDTEVILQLHASLGDSATAQLNGMFAYALWDRVRQRLLLARDRAGIKPLYYGQSSRGFAFGSEIKAIFESGLIRPQFDEGHLAEYLVFRHVAGTENLFAGIAELAPGHLLAVSNGHASEPKSFWNASAEVPKFDGGYSAAVESLDAALNEAVKRQLVADVPLGTFCSGGIDSSLTTVIAARHMSDPINTFSVSFDAPDFDESRYAKLASSSCRSRHHEIRIPERRFVELLPKLIWHHDLPLNFANSVHIYAVSELARQHVKVVLTGEGADELFGGYPRYAIPRLAAGFDRIPAILREPLLGLARRSRDHRVRKLAWFATRSPASRKLFNSSGVDPDVAKQLLKVQDSVGSWKYRRQLAESTRSVARIDLETYLVSILERQDKMSMATSLEARVPFLDNEIIEFSFALPERFKHTLRHRKRILKDVARRYLPQAIVDRRKSGFGVPLASWMRDDGPVGALLTEVTNYQGVLEVFERNQLDAMLREHRSGARDHSELLWGILNLALWRDAFRC
jgi:asparagine synthase (glutamine-hydrolysing)